MAVIMCNVLDGRSSCTDSRRLHDYFRSRLLNIKFEYVCTCICSTMFLFATSMTWTSCFATDRLLRTVVSLSIPVLPVESETIR